MFVIIDKDSTTFYNNNKMFVSKPASVTPYLFEAHHFRTEKHAQKYIEKLNKHDQKVYGNTTNYEIEEVK